MTLRSLSLKRHSHALSLTPLGTCEGINLQWEIYRLCPYKRITMLHTPGNTCVADH